MQAITRFLDVRDRLAFSHMSAQHRAWFGVDDVHMFSVLRRAIVGDSREIARMNARIAARDYVMAFGHARDIPIAEMIHRVIVFSEFDEVRCPELRDFARNVAHISCTEIADSIWSRMLELCEERRGIYTKKPESYNYYHIAPLLDAAFIAIITHTGDDCKLRTHCAYVEEIVEKVDNIGAVFFRELIDVINSTPREWQSPRVSEFFEQDSRDSSVIPFGLRTMELFVGDDAPHARVSFNIVTRTSMFSAGNANCTMKIGPNLARQLLDTGEFMVILAQYPRKSAEFARALGLLRAKCCGPMIDDLAYRESAPKHTIIKNAILQAARNPDDAAFGAVMNLLRPWRDSEMAFEINWATADGAEMLARMSSRLRARGECYFGYMNWSRGCLSSAEEAEACASLLIDMWPNAKFDFLVASDARNLIRIYGEPLARVIRDRDSSVLSDVESRASLRGFIALQLGEGEDLMFGDDVFAE
jgi:hypothetical protein